VLEVAEGESGVGIGAEGQPPARFADRFRNRPAVGLAARTGMNRQG